MKKFAILFLAAISIVACKKDKDESSNKVRFVVSGTEVTQFKFTSGATDYFTTVPFTGTKDTTIYVNSGTTVKLDAKANSSSLSGLIYVNDSPVASGGDEDLDGDNKTQVKIEYIIPK